MGSFCPTASTVIRADAIKPYIDFTHGLPVGDYFRQCLGAMRGGAIYLPETMSFYRTDVPGSWTSKSVTARAGLKHFRNMYSAFSQFNEVTNYKFSKQIAYVKSRQAWYAARGALSREAILFFKYYIGFVPVLHAMRLGGLSMFAKMFSFAPMFVLMSYKLWVRRWRLRSVKTPSTLKR